MTNVRGIDVIPSLGKSVSKVLEGFAVFLYNTH